MKFLLLISTYIIVYIHVNIDTYALEIEYKLITSYIRVCVWIFSEIAKAFPTISMCVYCVHIKEYTRPQQTTLKYI